MHRSSYFNLAEKGLRMPIGTDLILHEKPDRQAILLDGRRLGQVVEETARRFRTPLAIGLMDLMLEKATLLGAIGISPDQVATYHFCSPPGPDAFAAWEAALHRPPPARLAATVGAVAYIAQQTDLFPVGMTIGPFSLMTKLIADPITPVYMAGAGATAADDPEVQLVEEVLELSLRVVKHSMEAQLRAGAKAILVAEPAGSAAYISPNQLDAGSDIFDRCVIAPNRSLKALLDQFGADLFYHCCGELTDHMIRRICTLDPAILSLGSSRKLWEVAPLVPKTIVLFGNLPTKKFYSDQAITVEQVRQLSDELVQRMREAGHPFILGSECDVLAVDGCEETIKRKIDAMLMCGEMSQQLTTGPMTQPRTTDN